MDLSKMSWRWWRFEVARLAGIALDHICFYWGGPPCTTFSKGDAGNERESGSFNYRDHSQASRPPAHPEGSARGDLARGDDALAYGLVKMYMNQGAPWMLENPAGYLYKREYMREVEWLRRQVSYCAYWSKGERKAGNFQKHTHLWTNRVYWNPEGDTGTGRCKGHNDHVSLQEVKSQEVRCRVPEALVLEWLRSHPALLI